MPAKCREVHGTSRHVPGTISSGSSGYPARVAAETTPRSSRIGSRILVALAILLGAVIAASVLAVLPPVASPTLPDDAEARGEAFEQALAAALTKVRPAGEEWAIAIDPADINAWLATRLPKWIAHDPGLANLARATTLRLAAIDGALLLEDSARPNGAPIISLPLTVSIDSGRLRLGTGTARIGRLPVPGSGSALAAYLRTSLDELASGPAEIRLSDRRRVAVRAVSCVPGELRLLFAAVPAASP